ncbi:transglutaminase family protein [Parahaliea maris]|uniref:Transglutaminase family protein n=1 Tax=Parahaliea maris TaxID=2716870 RepID=A0A5C8ZKW2_9GAMM|nr:transglutaminase family protein [Parahaliea maris]TXS89226.1 transglutaminase family protein [Parahaliea maris]
MKYRVTHTTRYLYRDTVNQCHSVAHLLPRDTPYQQCSRAEVLLNPLPVLAADRRDYFGNRSYHFSVQEPHEVLEITAVSEVDVSEGRSSLALDFGPTCAEVLAQLEDASVESNLLVREFQLDSPLVACGPELAEYAADSFASDRPFLSGVRDLTHRIFTDFAYDPHYTDVATPLTEVIQHRRGVCQDFAHFAIGCLRTLGFPARYVSGYLETLPPPGETKLQGADASHAWFSVYSPAEGWCDFDPTNNLLAADQHITTAWGRDYADVTPLKGTIQGGGDSHGLEVEVDVTRLEGMPA